MTEISQWSGAYRAIQGQSLTSDRPCISERGMMVCAGTEVVYVARVAAQAVRCRMADGSLEVLNATCFPGLR